MAPGFQKPERNNMGHSGDLLETQGTYLSQKSVPETDITCFFFFFPTSDINHGLQSVCLLNTTMTNHPTFVFLPEPENLIGEKQVIFNVRELLGLEVRFLFKLHT